MRRSRSTETQLVAILKEAKAGKAAREVCHQHGISEATSSHWKAKYGGMSASDLTRLKESEGAVTQYKRMYAERARENDAWKAFIANKLYGPRRSATPRTTWGPTGD